ncbi:MAG: DUF305 domain-containing protein [Micromonosporaceae bacterium]
MGGIHMVDGLLAQAHDPQVRELAEAMKAGQTAEIQVLQDRLAELGAKPLTG